MPIDFCRCSVVIACSVTTVFGADVPDGSWPISWMGGLAMQLPAGQGHWLSLFGPVSRAEGLPAALLVAVGELHQAHRRQSRTHREDVGVGVDLATA